LEKSAAGNAQIEFSYGWSKRTALATSWPIMSVFGYDASLLPRDLCGEMSGAKTTAIATQNGQASLAVFGLNFGHAPKTH